LIRGNNTNPNHYPRRFTFSTQNHTIEDYYCDKFQVIPIRGFRFIALTYTSTHIHTSHHHKVIAISAPPYYVVGEDNEIVSHW